jgi:hypothetical protein
MPIIVAKFDLLAQPHICDLTGGAQMFRFLLQAARGYKLGQNGFGAKALFSDRSCRSAVSIIVSVDSRESLENVLHAVEWE